MFAFGREFGGQASEEFHGLLICAGRFARLPQMEVDGTQPEIGVGQPRPARDLVSRFVGEILVINQDPLQKLPLHRRQCLLRHQLTFGQFRGHVVQRLASVVPGPHRRPALAVNFAACFLTLHK